MGKGVELALLSFCSARQDGSIPDISAFHRHFPVEGRKIQSGIQAVPSLLFFHLGVSLKAQRREVHGESSFPVPWEMLPSGPGERECLSGPFHQQR